MHVLMLGWSRAGNDSELLNAVHRRARAEPFLKGEKLRGNQQWFDGPNTWLRVKPGFTRFVKVRQHRMTTRSGRWRITHGPRTLHSECGVCFISFKVCVRCICNHFAVGCRLRDGEPRNDTRMTRREMKPETKPVARGERGRGNDMNEVPRFDAAKTARTQRVRRGTVVIELQRQRI